MTNYVVQDRFVNVWDPDADDLKTARRERQVRRLEHGATVTDKDLAFADVKRLLALGSIKEQSEAQADAEDAGDTYDQMSNKQLKAEVKRRNETRENEDDWIAPESNSNDALRLALRGDDAANGGGDQVPAGTTGIPASELNPTPPEAQGAKTPQAH